MKQGRKKTFKTAILKNVSFIIFAIIALMTAYVLFTHYNNAMRSEEEKAKKFVFEISEKINKELSKAFYTSETIAHILSSVKNEENPLILKREQVFSLLSNVLLENKNYHAVFTLWEKDAFDANDDAYKTQTEDHDKTGRLIPYITKTKNGNFTVEPLQEYKKKGAGNYYRLPKKLMTNVVIDPYIHPSKHENDTVVSFVSPIEYKHYFLGIAGVNIRLHTLQQLLHEFDQNEYSAKITLIAFDGTIAAYSSQDTMKFQNIEKFYDDETFKEELSDIQNGISKIELENNAYLIKAPIYIGQTNRPWQLRVMIPENQLRKTFAEERNNVILFGIFIFILSFIYLRNYFTQKTTPLNVILEAADRFSIGDLDIKLELKTDDEFEDLALSLNKLLDGLKEISEVGLAVANGDFSKFVSVKSENDKVAEAINGMNVNLKKAEEENEFRRNEATLRNWTSQGIADLGDILRKRFLDIEDMGVAILSKLVNHLGAAQAGLFVINDRNKKNIFIELIAAFAYDQKKYLKRKLEMGESLIGTCAIEKETIFLKKIPDDYIQITSGLGQKKPTSLVIVPLKIENEVLGVLEIASLKVIEKHEIEFAERAAESIALTISTLKVNERTTMLLSQSRKQAEELENRDREMQQNLRDLKLVQQESNKREAEMSGVLKSLNASSLVAEYDMNGKFIGINDEFLRLFGMSKKQILGKSFISLGLLDMSQDEYDILWKNLRLGINKKALEYHLKFPDGQEFYLTQTFTPILDDHGNAYKVLVIASDITKLKVQEIELSEKAEILQTQKEELLKKDIDTRALINSIDYFLMSAEYLPDGTILRMNDNLMEKAGYAKEELIGNNLFDFVYGVEKKRFMKMWQGLLIGKSFRITVERKRKDGTGVWAMSAYVPSLDKNGNVYKIIALGIDITEYKENEQRAIQKLNELKQSIEQKKS